MCPHSSWLTCPRLASGGHSHFKNEMCCPVKWTPLSNSGFMVDCSLPFKQSHLGGPTVKSIRALSRFLGELRPPPSARVKLAVDSRPGLGQGHPVRLAAHARARDLLGGLAEAGANAGAKSAMFLVQTCVKMGDMFYAWLAASVLFCPQVWHANENRFFELSCCILTHIKFKCDFVQALESAIISTECRSRLRKSGWCVKTLGFHAASLNKYPSAFSLRCKVCT